MRPQLYRVGQFPALYARHTNIAVVAETLLSVKDLLSRGVIVLPAEGVNNIVGFLIQRASDSLVGIAYEAMGVMIIVIVSLIGSLRKGYGLIDDVASYSST
jgi:hypothetical protein